MHLAWWARGQCCHIWEWPCDFYKDMSKSFGPVKMSCRVIENLPAAPQTQRERAEQLIRGLISIFCVQLCKMGSILQAYEVLWLCLQSVCQRWILTFGNGKYCAASFPHHFYFYCYHPTDMAFVLCSIPFAVGCTLCLDSKLHVFCAVTGMPFNM